MSIILYDLCASDPAIRFSPYCWRVRMALLHKGLAFDTVPVPFTAIGEIGGGFSKTLPVLEDEGKLIRDSWDIAVHLEHRFPDAPSLFGGAAGLALTEFVVQWVSSALIRPLLLLIAKDICDRLAPADQAHFRQSRERLFRISMEEAEKEHEAKLPSLRAGLAPLRKTFAWRPFLGGKQPLFADYAVFSALQWARIMSDKEILAPDDPVRTWFERCLDLHNGAGRAMPAALPIAAEDNAPVANV